MTTNTPSTLLQTIESDLSAGASWLEQEALGAGLFLWNTLKGAFIALEPAAGQLLVDVLTGAVNNASAGDSVEQIETAALNTASTEAKAALSTAGSAAVKQIIIGIQSNLQQSAAASAAPATAS
jgi:hypothetical protein